MIVDGWDGDPDDGIPPHVLAEMDAAAAAYSDAQALAGSQVWAPERWTDRLGRRWRAWRRPACVADAKAAAVRRAQAVASAERLATLTADDAVRRGLWLAYFRALQEVKRHDGADAVRQVAQASVRQGEMEIKAREFEQSITYVVDPQMRARIAAEIFDDEDNDVM